MGFLYNINLKETGHMQPCDTLCMILLPVLTFPFVASIKDLCIRTWRVM